MMRLQAALLPLALALDHFQETLHLRALPRIVDEPELYLARWEFEIQAEFTDAFRTDHFDLFPSPIGKLLNAYPSIESFEATLTRGRWKSAWGEVPWEFRPPGAVLATALAQANDTASTASAYRFLVSTLAGSLCASFEGMNPAVSAEGEVQLSNNAGARPLQLPSAWSAKGTSFRLATLPYEPVCTENLTPWLKLLPCGRHRGLGALLSSLVLAVAEAPLTSLTLAARSDERAAVRASLDVVLPGDAGSLPAWLKSFAARDVAHCVAADSSELMFWWPGKAPVLPDTRVLEMGERQVLVVPTMKFLQGSMAEFFSGPWSSERRLHAPRVMRDMLSQEGRSERTHGRYLLRLSNEGRSRHVRFLDQLPFFIRPLWHSLRAVWADGDREVELHGAEALKRLQLQFTSSDGLRSPTDFSLSVELKSGGSVSLFLDVLKNFINFREFSYACEKGFDVGGAVWLDDEAEDAAAGTISTAGFAAPLGPSLRQHEAQPSSRLHFTEGMLVMVPMPDFSMPFNVVALSSTAATFFFGSIFRFTATHHPPHWSTQRGTKKKTLHPMQALALLTLLGCLGLNALTAEHMNRISMTLSQAGESGQELYSYLAIAKERVDSILAKR
ncbi:unnamed protein product [Durusdinium trenchii]|uniref:GPI transamidase component PIG-T n=1 Tax=Durusdinium trenchii TaxID=1381693 RepID=A0ABP0R4G0_9DINO